MGIGWDHLQGTRNNPALDLPRLSADGVNGYCDGSISVSRFDVVVEGAPKVGFSPLYVESLSSR